MVPVCVSCVMCPVFTAITGSCLLTILTSFLRVGLCVSYFCLTNQLSVRLLIMDARRNVKENEEEGMILYCLFPVYF